MSDETPIHLVVEDALSEAVLKRLLTHADRDFAAGHCYGKSGFGYIRRNLRRFNQAARSAAYLVLTDLDREKCPPILLRDWLGAPRHPNLLFRIAVREVEAWLMADRQGFAGFLKISPIAIPVSVETLPDPKRTLVNLARKSRSAIIRKAIVPTAGWTATQGPDYNGALIHFVQSVWDVDRASAQSDSLYRTIRAIQEFRPSMRK